MKRNLWDLPACGDSLMHYIPDEFRRTVEAELAPGESVPWVGQPSPQRLARLGRPFFYFGPVWTLFFVLLLFMLSGFEVPDPREHTGAFIFCSIFMAIGFLVMSNPVWMRRHARKVLYVITDWRGLIVEII